MPLLRLVWAAPKRSGRGEKQRVGDMSGELTPHNRSWTEGTYWGRLEGGKKEQANRPCENSEDRERGEEDDG
jgi:hypothetical protein